MYRSLQLLLFTNYCKHVQSIISSQELFWCFICCFWPPTFYLKGHATLSFCPRQTVAPQCCRFGSPPLASVLLTKSASWLPHRGYMGVKNPKIMGFPPPKWMVLINGGAHPYFGNTHIHLLAKSNDVCKLKYHSSDCQILTFTMTWNHNVPSEDLAGHPHNKLS